MLARSGVARQFTRHVSSKSRKITVQLLKDYAPLGVAGQLVRVKPAFMRNFLHVDNKACYVTKELGPRIPVVEKRVAVEAEKPAAEVNAEVVPASKDETPAMSLDELSSMFSSMRMSRSKAATTPETFQTEASTASYSLAELDESLPATYTLQNVKLPVTKETLASTVFSVTGIEVPVSMLKVRQGDGNALDEIASVGQYSWTFTAPGEVGSLKKNLRVQ